MNQLELITLCAEKFATEWANKTEVEWPNVDSSHTQVPYVRFSLNIIQTENACVGVTSPPKHTGFIVVQIFTASNVGYGQAYELANDVFTIFENEQFSGVIAYAGEVIDVGKDPIDSDLYAVNAQIPFDAI